MNQIETKETQEPLFAKANTWEQQIDDKELKTLLHDDERQTMHYIKVSIEEE